MHLILGLVQCSLAGKVHDVHVHSQRLLCYGAARPSHRRKATWVMRGPTNGDLLSQFLFCHILKKSHVWSRLPVYKTFGLASTPRGAPAVCRKEERLQSDELQRALTRSVVPYKSSALPIIGITTALVPSG